MDVIYKKGNITREVYYPEGNKLFKINKNFGLISRNQSDLEDGYWKARKIKNIIDKRGQKVPIFELVEKVNTSPTKIETRYNIELVSRGISVYKETRSDQYLDVQNMIFTTSLPKIDLVFSVKFTDLDLNYRVKEKLEDKEDLVKEYISRNREKIKKHLEKICTETRVVYKKVEPSDVKFLVDGEESTRLKEHFIYSLEHDVTPCLEQEEFDYYLDLDPEEEVIIQVGNARIEAYCTRSLSSNRIEFTLDGKELDNKEAIKMIARGLGYDVTSYEVIKQVKI